MGRRCTAFAGRGVRKEKSRGFAGVARPDDGGVIAGGGVVRGAGAGGGGAGGVVAGGRAVGGRVGGGVVVVVGGRVVVVGAVGSAGEDWAAAVPALRRTPTETPAEAAATRRRERTRDLDACSVMRSARDRLADVVRRRSARLDGV